MMNNAVKKTLLARVYDVATESPLEYAAQLSHQHNCHVYLKREDLQPVHSFKLRGAYNKMLQLTEVELAKGVITASAGNHAQGVALAAKKMNVSALIIMPKTTPAIKIDAVQSYGAEVELFGDSYSDAAEYCKKRAQETSRTFIHPFDDTDVIVGQGTIGREIIEQLPNVTHIFVPVGGGGLLAGIAQYVKQLKPEIRIIGVEPNDSNAMQQSLAAGKRIVLPHVGIFADGVAVKRVGLHTFNIAQKYVDEVITVSNDQICAAIKAIFEQTRGIVEPAGALAVAGINEFAKNGTLNHARVVAINSGANISFERLQYIAERTLLGSGKEAIFAISLPEKPGALKQYCDTILNGHGITQFGYRLNKRTGANILLGITVGNSHDKDLFVSKMRTHNYEFVDLYDDDIAKEHVRHMIGGPAPNAKKEHFYHISFPERPGALTEFLNKTSSDWNISLFHYRGQGGDVGSVLIGFEADDIHRLEQAITATRYQWERLEGIKSIKEFLV